jgi:DNA-binding GntR family transcriptional regulator
VSAPEISDEALERLRRVNRGVRRRLRGRRFAAYVNADGQFPGSLADHDRIIDCLERGDREGAARAVDDNWRRGLDCFRSGGG